MHEHEIKLKIEKLLRHERKRDERSCLEKTADALFHDIKVFIERLSPIK